MLTAGKFTWGCCRLTGSGSKTAYTSFKNKLHSPLKCFHPWPCAGTRTCVDCTSILDVIEIISFILQQFWNFDHCTDAPKFPEVMSQKLISRTYFSNTAYFKVLKNCSLTLVSILAVLLLMPGYTDIDSLFQTPLPPIQRGIQRCNCSFIWTGKNKKVDLDKKHRNKKRKPHFIRWPI